MVSIFTSRNLIYWWVFLTSFVFLQQPARDLARNFFRNNQLFSTTSFPFNTADSVTKWIDDRARQVVVQFQFDPNAIVLKAGGTLILDGYRVGLLLIILLLILVVRFYMRALSSPAIFDDIAALVVCFFVYHLVAETMRIIKVPPFGAPAASGLTLGDQAIADRSDWVFFLGAVILLLVIGGRGWVDAQVFWKGLIELFLVWLFLIPGAAAAGFANLLEALAGFGAALQTPTNVAWAILWAAIGLLLAVYRLYHGVPGSPGGRPAAGARAGGSGGGGGGGTPRSPVSSALSRLTGGK